MKRFLTYTAALFLFFHLNSNAQNARFTTEGVIQFDKSVNMHAIIKKSINKNNESYMQQAFDQYKRTQPQFKILKSTLTFSKDKTLFRPIEDTNAGGGFFSDPSMGQNNVIFSDLASSSSITQKKIYEETFLVKDSTRRINWKITDEKRVIAGYDCRRANALILDSIYVVAFYTEEIPTSGGPESFSGLPGMILGVALPHEHTTWFATNVSDKAVAPTALTPPSKGKATDNKGLRDTIMKALKDWGDYAQTALKAFLL